MVESDGLAEMVAAALNDAADGLARQPLYPFSKPNGNAAVGAEITRAFDVQFIRNCANELLVLDREARDEHG